MTDTKYESKILGAEKDEVFSGLFDAIIEAAEGPQETQLAVRENVKTAIEKTAERVDALVVFVKAHRFEADRLKQLEQMIAAKRRRIEAACDAFESSVHTQMQEWGVTKVSGNTFELALRKNPASVEVVDAKLIPAEFLDYPEPTISKSRIKDALKEGKEVPGAVLRTDKTTLNMR